MNHLNTVNSNGVITEYLQNQVVLSYASMATDQRIQ